MEAFFSRVGFREGTLRSTQVVGEGALCLPEGILKGGGELLGCGMEPGAGAPGSLTRAPLRALLALHLWRGPRAGRAGRGRPAGGSGRCPLRAARPDAPCPQLHRAHRHGHPAEPGGPRDPVRHLRLHHAQVPLLPRQPARLAELGPPQPVPQQLLRQGERPAPASAPPSPQGFPTVFFVCVCVALVQMSRWQVKKTIRILSRRGLDLAGPPEWSERTLFPPGVERTHFENVGL